jgi:hypothetical protein
MVNVPHPEGLPQNPSVRHEPSDANFSWIMGIGIASLVLAVLIHWGLLGALFGYINYQAEIKKSTFPLAEDQKAVLPKQPRLEAIDRMATRQGVGNSERQPPSEAELNSYGSTSEEGYVRIPIDRAMKLMESELPIRKEKSENRGQQGAKR